MLYVFLRSYTNVSNLKRSKMIEITANKPHTYTSSTISSFAIEKDTQEINLPMDSAIIKSTESSTPKITSQLSNVVNGLPTQPCANFLTSFKTNVLPDTGPASSSTSSLKNIHSSSTDPSRRFLNAPRNPDESDESTRSWMSSMRESTSSPAPTIFEVTPLSRRLSFKKKNNLAELESSLILICQNMHQRLQDNRNYEVTGSLDETFAKLIVNQLERLPPHEKQKRQQTIMQILYEPYDF